MTAGTEAVPVNGTGRAEAFILRFPLPSIICALCMGRQFYPDVVSAGRQ
jgi:hypothetical protein